MDSVKVLKLDPRAQLPVRATEGAAGYDLFALLEEPLRIPPAGRAVIPTGIAIQLPGPSFGAFIFARSGLAVRHGLALSNGVGLVDSDYRGEIKVGLVNLSDREYTLTPGERIAQMVILPVALPPLQEVETLEDTDRGQGGFGSTGR